MGRDPSARSTSRRKTALLEEARATKGKGADVLKIYLDQDSDTLDGFEFLTLWKRARSGTGA